jgi:hypothetical protein
VEEAGPGGEEEGASDLRVEGDAALQPAGAGTPQARQRRAHQVLHKNQKQTVEKRSYMIMICLPA